MGNFLSIITALYFSLGVLQHVPFQTTQKAFAQADAKGIVALGKDKMMLRILGKESLYSGSQSVLILKDFFAKYPPASFEFTLKGGASGDAPFAIGTYKSGQDKFRVSLQYKKSDSEFKIESLSIER